MADEEDRIIWAWREDHGDIWTGEWAPPGEDHIPDHAQEYIPRAEADAMVAAALRMAMEMVKEGMFIVAPEGVRQREALASYRTQAASLIASLTPADAAAALDEVRRRAFKEGMRAAATLKYDPKYGKDWLGMSAAILAALEEPK